MPRHRVRGFAILVASDFVDLYFRHREKRGVVIGGERGGLLGGDTWLVLI